MLLIAHRGYIKKYPENSLIGIKYAFSLEGIDGVEFDVRITKDNSFVLIHDFFIDRVSNGSGVVSNLKYKELLKYNFGNKKYNLKITKLNDVLKIKTNKIFLIELKFDYEEYIVNKKKLLKLLEKYKYKKIYIFSFNKKIINDLKNSCDHFKYGYVVYKDKEYTNIDFVAINYKFYKSSKNKEIFLWTVNNYDDIIFKKKNIDGLITDYPLKIRKEYNEHI